MGCCILFDLIFGHDPKRGAKSANSNLSRGSTQEHLLKYDQVVKSPVSGSAPECPVSPPERNGNCSNREDLVLVGTQKNLSYEESDFRPSDPAQKRRHVNYTRHVIRSEDCNGMKLINNYAREGVIGIGSYSKVVLCRNIEDQNLYAMKIVQKSRLRKIKVAPSETALTDVFKEVSIMKELDHPNIVKLIEVIDDPESDRLYLILEHVEGRCMFDGSGPPGGIGEELALKYFRDVVEGLIYLHSHGNNDELRRSPGTPVYTAPECILGPTYGGRAADVWALGVTLYCMITGRYPFIGDTLQSTYDEIVQSSLKVPDGLNPELVDLLEGLLCKDPNKRMTLDAVTKHICFKTAT